MDLREGEKYLPVVCVRKRSGSAAKEKLRSLRCVLNADARRKRSSLERPSRKIACNRGSQLQRLPFTHRWMNYGTKNIISKELVFRQLFRLSPGRQIERCGRDGVCRSSRPDFEPAKLANKREKKVKCVFRATKKLSAFQRPWKVYLAPYGRGSVLFSRLLGEAIIAELEKRDRPSSVFFLSSWTFFGER